jgi:F-type H+-transporting ATPase subunit b
MAEETHSAGTEAHGGAVAPHAYPKALGMDATMWVALAMLVVIGLAVWKKVPAMIGAALDKQIAGIRENLSAAEQLRKDAEALKAEYEGKARQAAKDAEAMKAHAEAEARDIVAKAKADATALIARRSAMAEQKIAAAEIAAVADVRAKAAAAATAAATRLIATAHDAKADKAIVDATIAKLN